tara:strand:- start:345 stop:914 length:570 start_codon:yes stop_codon:yes gene_type:complete
MNEYELALKEYMDRLKGGFQGAMTGVMDGLGGGTGLSGKGDENNFLSNLLGVRADAAGLEAGTPEYRQFMQDSLSPVNMRSMVSTNNDSGTDPLMMAGANAVGAGLNNVAQPVMNSIGFPDSRGFDTPANRDNYNLRRIQQLESMLTADEANVYYQLEDFQKDAFLQAIEENKISQYEAENFDRLRMPY